VCASSEVERLKVNLILPVTGPDTDALPSCPESSGVVETKASNAPGKPAQECAESDLISNVKSERPVVNWNFTPQEETVDPFHILVAGPPGAP
jgi:hypothetical protein